MTIDSVIFDIEGTLVDSVKQTLRCWRETLLEFGHDVPIDQLQARSGMDGNMMLEQLLPELSDAGRKKLIKAQGGHYQKVYLPHIQPFEGARETLLSLKSRKLKFALATDCEGAPLAQYRRILQIDNLLDAIACGEDTPKGKPNPELIGRALQKLGASPDHAVMVGDTPSDAKAARKAGIPCIGLLTGGHPAEALRKAGCETVLETIRDLPSGLHGAPGPFAKGSGVSQA
jgi:HAD superfamily hydrolase (TIGR01509 family)